MSLTPNYNMNPSAKEKYMEVFGPAEDRLSNTLEGTGKSGGVCYREIISRPKGTDGYADKVLLVNERDFLQIEKDTEGMSWDAKYKAAEKAVEYHVVPGEKVLQANTYCDGDLLELLQDFYGEINRA